MKKTTFRKFLAVTIIFSMLLQIVPAGIFADFATKKAEAATTINYGRHDALDSSQYSDFYFNIDSSNPNMKNPEDFDENISDNPLQDYEPVLLSELYVGYVNKSKHYEGKYAVYDGMENLSVSNATITDPNNSKIVGNMDKHTIIESASYPDIPGSGTTKNKRQAHNAIALNMGLDTDGKPSPEKLVEVSLYTGESGSGLSKHKKSYLNLKLMTKNGKKYDTNDNIYKAMTSSNNSAYDDINVVSNNALTTMAAGDFNGDGRDEVAVYHPILDGASPKIVIYEITPANKFSELASINLSDMNNARDKAQFNFAFHSWLVPIVHLATTSISGKDDLVINASLPFHDGNKYDVHEQSSAMAIYSYTGGTMKKVFYDNLTYENPNISPRKVDTMRFVSAVDADLLGNGKEAIVLAGYHHHYDPDAKVPTIGNKDIGKIEKEIYINAVVWNSDNKYQKVYDEPLEVKPLGFGNLDAKYDMKSPVTLAAAKLSAAINADYLFAEGAVIQFVASPSLPTTLAEQLKASTYNVLDTMDMGALPLNIHIGTAVAGHFAKDRPSSEQIVVTSARSMPTLTLPGTVYMDISWIWFDGLELKFNMTNHSYIDNRQANNNGTFLTICGVEQTENTTYYKYVDKMYGWSAPFLVAALPAVPYWKELPYNPGNISFSVGHQKDEGVNVDVDISGGASVAGSATFGAGFLGNEGRIGPQGSASLLLGGAYHYTNEKTYASSERQTWPGNTDYVLLAAIPVVRYDYKAYVPDMVVDQEYVNNYNAHKSSTDPLCPPIGSVIPAHYEDVSVYSQFNFQYSLMPLEEYNLLCAGATIPGIEHYDMSKEFPHVPGDPSTYKNQFSLIQNYPTKDKQYLTTGTALIDSRDRTIDFEFNKSKAINKSGGGQVSFNAELGVKIQGEFSFFASAEGDLNIGGAIAINAGFSCISTKTNSESFGVSMNPLPDGYSANPDYSFQTQVSVWRPDEEANTKALMYMGYTVNLRGALPPKTPENVYAYGETTNSIMLAWDFPSPLDPRAADEYEVFIEKNGSYISLGRIKALEKNYFLVTELDPDTKYEFAFKAYKKIGVQDVMGGYSIPFFAKTQSNSTLAFTKPIKDQTVAVDGTAEFTAKAEDRQSGNIISYEWQEYIRAGNGAVFGEWKKLKDGDGGISISINNSSEAELSVTGAQSSDDGRIFRVIAYSTPQSSVGHAVPTSIISRAAMLYVGGTDRPTLSLDITGASVPDKTVSFNGEVFAENGTELTLKATLLDDAGDPMDGKSINFYVYKDGTIVLNSAANTVGSGVAAVNWTPNESAVYKVMATYEVGASPAIGQFGIDLPVEQPPADNDPPQDGQPPADNEPPQDGQTDSDDADGQQLEGDETARASYFDFNSITAEAENTDNTIIDDIVQNPPDEPTEEPKDEPEKEKEKETEELAPTQTLIAAPMASGWGIIRSEVITVRTGTLDSRYYKINYVLNGGTNHNDNPTTVFKNSRTTYTLGAATKPYAGFNGWYTIPSPDLVSDPDAGKVERIIPADLSEDLTLYAVYTPIEYNVTYVLNGGTPTTNPIKYTMYSSVTLVDSTRDGYNFMGWYTNLSDENSRVYSLPQDGPHPPGALTLYAKWEPIEYSIFYMLDGGVNNPANPDSYTIVDAITFAAPTKTIVKDEVFTFAGWYDENDTEVTQIPAGSKGDRTLYAKWNWNMASVYFDERVSETYLNSLKSVLAGFISTLPPELEAELTNYLSDYIPSNRAPVNGLVLVQKNKPVAQPTPPTLSGFIFGGWYTDEARTTPWNFNNNVTNNMILYAKWTVNSSNLAVVTYFDPLEAAIIGGVLATQGGVISEPTAPKHVGYVFEGWYKDKEYTQIWDFDVDTVPSLVTELYAKWRDNFFTVTFDSKGGSAVQAQSVREGGTAAVPNAPSLSGYNFGGWYLDAECTRPWDFSNTVDSNMTLYAKWNSIGGGGSGGSGGGAAMLSTANADNMNGTITVYVNDHPMPGTIINGVLTLTYDTAFIEAEDDHDGDYWIETSGSEILNLNLPISALNEENSSLTVSTDFGAITIPDEVLRYLRETYGDTLRLVITRGSVKVTFLDENENAIVYDNPKTPLLITLPFSLASGQHSGAVVAIKKEANGNKILPYAVYREGGNGMLFYPVYDNSESSFRVSGTGTYDFIYNEKSFNDDMGHWAHDYITFLAARELMYGVGDGNFSPNGYMTRAMFAKVLANLDGADLSLYETSHFSDIPSGKWYTSAVEWAFDKGIVSGVGNNSFAPDDSITREQMAVMLNNFIEYSEMSLGTEVTSAFADEASISDWAKNNVRELQKYGIISGKPGNLFDPHATATRGEITVIFTKLVELAAM